MAKVAVDLPFTDWLTATVTNNVIQNLTAGSGVDIINQDVTSILCLDANGNSNGASGPPSSGGAGNNAFRFFDNGSGGDMEITQASLGLLGTANNGGASDVTVTSGTVTFSQTCATPP